MLRITQVQLLTRINLGTSSLAQQSRLLTNAAAKKLDLSGIFPPLITNFTTLERIDYTAIEKNMTKWQTYDFSGYVIFGSNGEACLIDPKTRAHHIKSMQSLIHSTGGRKRLLICGVNAESSRAAIEQCQMFSESGADALLMTTPSFYKSNLNHEALVAFYKEVSDNSPSPVIVYNMPANTGIDLSADTLLEILDVCGNVIGLKDSGGDVAKLSRVIHFGPPTAQVLAGSAGFLLPAMAIGCVGCVPALANVLGQEVIDLYHLAIKQEFKKAAILQARFVQPNAMVTRQFGVPGLKAAMEMFGYEGGPCISPLQPMKEAQKDQIRAAFIKSGFNPS